MVTKQINVNPPPLLLCSPPHFSFFSSLVPTPSVGCPLPRVGPPSAGTADHLEIKTRLSPSATSATPQKVPDHRRCSEALLVAIKVTPPTSRIGTPNPHLCQFSWPTEHMRSPMIACNSPPPVPPPSSKGLQAVSPLIGSKIPHPHWSHATRNLPSLQTSTNRDVPFLGSRKWLCRERHLLRRRMSDMASTHILALARVHASASMHWMQMGDYAECQVWRRWWREMLRLRQT